MNGLFGVNGLLGYLVAVVLLLSVVFWFGFNAVKIQSTTASQSYEIVNPMDIKMIDPNNANHVKINK